MSFVSFVSFVRSEVECRVGGERAMAGDDTLDIAFVNAVFNGELVFLNIVLAGINVVLDVINDGNVGVVGTGEMGPGEDVKNSLSETCCGKLPPLPIPEVIN